MGILTLDYETTTLSLKIRHQSHLIKRKPQQHCQESLNAASEKFSIQLQPKDATKWHVNCILMCFDKYSQYHMHFTWK